MPSAFLSYNIVERLRERGRCPSIHKLKRIPADILLDNLIRKVGAVAYSGQPFVGMNLINGVNLVKISLSHQFSDAIMIWDFDFANLNLRNFYREPLFDVIVGSVLSSMRITNTLKISAR